MESGKVAGEEGMEGFSMVKKKKGGWQVKCTMERWKGGM